MFGTYIGNNKLFCKTIWGGKYVLPADDMSVSLELLSEGVYEQSLTNFLLKNVKPGSNIVDIGANIGYFTILLGHLCGPQGKITAFEANPRLIPIINDNLSINYLHDRVKLINKAVSSNNNILKFNIATRFMGNSSIHVHNEEYMKNYFEQIEQIDIECVNLDSMVEKLGHIDFLKMDIEGGEYHALLGMQGILYNKSVNTIIIEFNKIMLQDDYTRLIDLLNILHENLDFRFGVLDQEGSLINVDMNFIKRNIAIPNLVIQVI